MTSQENQKPNALAPIFKSIPNELKELRQWVCWRYEWRVNGNGGGYWTKPLYNADTGRYADVSKPETWTTFDDAVAAYKRYEHDGVGFVFTEDDPYTGFDLDDCVVNGELSEDASDWVRRFRTYTEISPSGTGIKGICKGKPAFNGNNQKEGAEIYGDARYFTLTGHAIGGHQIEARQGVVNEFLVRYFPDKVKPKPQPEKEKSKPQQEKQKPANGAGAWIEPNRRIRIAFGASNGADIERLFNGDISGYGSQSEADLALCGYLAFYSSGSREALDTMFRSSKLLRDKWDEKHYSDGRTYGEGTIDKALESQTEFYEFSEEDLAGEDGEVNSE